MALFGQHKKKKSTLKKAIGVFVIPVAIFLSVLFVWWWVGDFWTYAQLLLFNQSSGVDANWVKGGDTYASGSNGMTFSGGSGATGLNLALLGQMSSGYMKDYLEIMRDHANWTYTYEGYKKSDVEIPLNVLVGQNKAESEPQKHIINGVEIRVPSSAVDPERYNCINGYNLYTVTSLWFQENGNDYNMATHDKARMQWGSPATDGGGSAHTTPFQFDVDWFALFPGGQLGKANAYGGFKPSLLNTGYGITEAEGTRRDVMKLDAAYFPDWCNQLIRSAYGRLFGNCDVSSVNDMYLAAGAMHIGHHSGGGEPRTIAVGFREDNGEAADNSPTTNAQQYSDFLNMYTPVLQKAIDYFAAHVDDGSLDWDPDLRTPWYGLGFGLMAGSYNIIFPETSDRDKYINEIQSNSEYRKGVVLGFTIARGTTVTADGVYAYLNDSTRMQSLGAGYPASTDMYRNSSGGFWIKSNTSNYIYAAGNGSTVAAVHGMNRENVAWCFMDPLYGFYSIWNMLKASGVDCTFAEVAGGQTGSLIDEIPVVVKNEPTEFYRGITMRDTQGHVLADSIAALERELTVECYCGEHATGKLSSKGAGYYYWYKGMSEGFLCKWHQTTAYYNRNGTGCSDGATYFPDAKRQGWFLQCPWWAVGRAREYIESKGYAQPDNFSDNGVAVAGRLVAMGYRDTGANPTGPGIISWSAAEHEYGHVAFIEIVDTDGTYYISEAGSGKGFYGINTQSAGQTYRKWGNNYYLKTTVALDP